MSKNWEVTTLGEAYDVRDGTHDSPKYIENGYPLITSKNLKNGHLTYDKVKYISEIDFNNINKRSKVDIGDLLFAMIGTIGNPIVIINEPNFAIKNVALFKVDSSNNSLFLKYYLDSSYVIDKMQKEAKGTTQRFVGLGYLRSFPIKLPKLEEQKQIVEILDKTFGSIEKAKINIEKNIQNSKELFASRLNEIFSQKGDGWEEKELGQTCVVIAGQSPESKFYNKDEKGLPFYQGKKEFKEKFIGNPTTWTTKITKEAFKNDILMSVRAPVGPVNFATQNICIGRGLAAIRASDKIEIKYLFHFLKFYESKIIGNNGAVFNSINKKQIEDLKISLPNCNKKQNQIIKKLDYLSEQTKQLEKQYQQKLNNLEELKKSILEKAFSGELLK